MSLSDKYLTTVVLVGLEMALWIGLLFCKMAFWKCWKNRFLGFLSTGLAGAIVLGMVAHVTVMALAARMGLQLLQETLPLSHVDQLPVFELLCLAGGLLFGRRRSFLGILRSIYFAVLFLSLFVKIGFLVGSRLVPVQ